MNRLKKRLNAGGPLIGGGITLDDPRITEMLGQVYDFLWIDMEHTGMSCASVSRHLIAARAAGCPAVVRIAWNDPVLAKPIVDLGPDGIVFPQVADIEDAKRALAACSYPPDGVRGWGPIRALNYGLADAAAYREDQELFPILQLENLDFFRDLDKILELKNLGAICVGPCDLSAALGKLCQLQDPDLLTILDTVAEKTRQHGVPLMVSLGYDETNLRQWLDRGADMVQLGSDYGCMLKAAQQELAAARTMCCMQK